MELSTRVDLAGSADGGRGSRSLWNRLKIGERLTAGFIAITLLMLAADAVALWQLHSIRVEAQRLTQIDDKLIGVLRVHTNLQSFRQRLDALAAARDVDQFVLQTKQLSSALLQDIEQAKQALSNVSPSLVRDPTLLPTLEAIESTVPSQVGILINLVTAGDWAAVQMRSDAQLTALSALTTSLIEKVDSEVTTERLQALENIQRVEQRVLLTLSATAVVTLFAAAVLGLQVTRSITRPLAQLGRSASALAHGNFLDKVEVSGRDELADLAKVFNDTGGKLQSLYEDLRSSEARFRTVIETAQVGITVFGVDGRVQFCNPTAENIFGLTQDDVQGRRYDVLTTTAFYENGQECPPEERPVSRALRTGKASRGTLLRIYRTAFADWIWVLADAAPVFKSDGSLWQVVTTVTNITNQMEAEEALKRSEAEFRMIFDNAAIGMTLVDPTGRLIRTNPAMQKLLQYSDDEIQQMNFAGITHPDDIAESSILFQDLVEGKRDGYRIRKRYIRKDGETCWTWLTTSAMRDAGGSLQYCVSMVEDITQQEIAQDSLRQLSTRMLRVQEEEQRRIAREVHDSTSQEMTALALHLGAVKKSETSLSPKAMKLISKCLSLAQQVSREIRTFSYLLHPPMLDEFGLWTALRVFVTEFRNRSGIRATIDIEDYLDGDRLDPSQEIAMFRFVQEAFANVYRHSGSKTAAVHVWNEAGFVNVTVADQGRGIPAKVLKELNPFTGRLGSVGIPGMRERISQIGGNLEIASGKTGTILTARIPEQLPGSV
jgi:two-component system, NarL family, sensor kinase